MNTDTIFFIVVAAAILFIGLFNWYFSDKQIACRKLRSAVGKPINKFVNGETAKIVGKVQVVGKPLVAPLSKRSCAYYYVMVERKVNAGSSNSYWTTIIEEENSTKFLARDGKRFAYVNSTNIKKHIVEDRDYSSGFLNDATDDLKRYLQKHGHESENWLGFNKTLRYTEAVLEEGELIAVIGKGEWVDAKRFDLPDSYGKILKLDSYEQFPVYLSDDPATVRGYNMGEANGY